MPPQLSQKPRKQPKQARSIATVEAILEAAAQVFCEQGYTGGTTDKVAIRAGVSIGSLYQYFPNKEALLLALAERHMEEGFLLIREKLAAALITQPPLKQLLRHFVEALIVLHQVNPDLHRVLFNEAPLPPSFTAEKEAAERKFAGELVALFQQYPEVKAEDMSVSCYLLVQAVEGLVHGYILYPPKDIEADKLVHEIVRMLYRYLVQEN